MQKNNFSEPVILLILDGWGLAPDSDSNAISKARHPNYDYVLQNSSHTRLWAHGGYVGLLGDQDGNSEAGHLNLGAGRIVKQDPVVVSDAIKDGTFFKNSAFLQAVQYVKKENSAMHLMGMLSDGQSAHSTPEHLYALLDLMEKEGVKKVFLHLFSDGRDSSPFGGKKQLRELYDRMKPNQKVASLTGRFYAMDRKKEWKRTEASYNAIVFGEGEKSEDLFATFEKYYLKGKSDEFFPPHVVCENGAPVGVVNDNDSIIFFNHRSDRARQLTKVFTQENFHEANEGSFVPKKNLKNIKFVAMTDFGPELGNAMTAYPTADVKDTLPMILSEKRQVYISEKEKYAHVTYFFNGGYAEPVNGEDRIMVPSPDVDSYDQDPGMSTPEINAKVLEFLKQEKYDFYTINFACPDMVGHTGNFEAGKLAVEACDVEIGKLVSQIKTLGGTLVLTADHGNIEEMKDLATGEIDTKHSKNQVPFMIWSPNGFDLKLREEGVLGDVAPTILDLFGIEKPKSMTGKSLII